MPSSRTAPWRRSASWPRCRDGTTRPTRCRSARAAIGADRREDLAPLVLARAYVDLWREDLDGAEEVLRDAYDALAVDRRGAHFSDARTCPRRRAYRTAALRGGGAADARVRGRRRDRTTSSRRPSGAPCGPRRSRAWESTSCAWGSRARRSTTARRTDFLLPLAEATPTWRRCSRSPATATGASRALEAAVRVHEAKGNAAASALTRSRLAELAVAPT